MEIHLVVDETVYEVVLGPAGDVPREALCMFRHGGEQTTVIPAGHGMPANRREGAWRSIAVEADLPFDTVGFFRRFADALADASIPILPFASFRFDHVLVPEDRLDDALAAIQPVVAALRDD